MQHSSATPSLHLGIYIFGVAEAPGGFHTTFPAVQYTPGTVTREYVMRAHVDESTALYNTLSLSQYNIQV